MSLPDKVVAASGNPGKLRELRALLDGLGIRVLAQSEFGVEDADETGETFVENALIKARHAMLATGFAAIADDSGLVVDALGGRPGVRSARYAGEPSDDEANNDKLLADLAGVPDARRGAAFHCTVVFVAPDEPDPVIASGDWRGFILHERRGAGGFGYDPLFLDPETGRSSAELSPEEKNARSHRGMALRKLVEKLRTRQ